MSKETPEVGKLLRQQTAIAGFGSFALHEGDLNKVLTEAARICAEGLDVPLSKVCRYRLAENDLLIEAGHGWHKGVVGEVVSRADHSSPQGRAFITGEPSICNDLSKDHGFELPAFYAAHHIVSTIDVVIKGEKEPWGVLEIDNNKQHDYDQQDIIFLTGFANVLAEAVGTSTRAAILQKTIDQMKVLVEEKDRLLDQKNVLAEELQHRVRNNLQLVSGMLSKQLVETEDKSSQQGLKSIASRVSTLSQIYDHLLGSEMARTIDFGAYLKSLCFNLAKIQAVPDGAVTLTCDSEIIILDIDTVTVLGLVVAELVTNSYDHAFPGGTGSIAISLLREAAGADLATMTISDNGVGFDEAKGSSKRHGVSLVRRLMQQVQGTTSMHSDHGTVWTIKFPVTAQRLAT